MTQYACTNLKQIHSNPQMTLAGHDKGLISIEQTQIIIRKSRDFDISILICTRMYVYIQNLHFSCEIILSINDDENQTSELD